MKKNKLRKPGAARAPVISNELDIKTISTGLKIIGGGQFMRVTDTVIPYGVNNLYPDEIYNATRFSPTAKGCVGLRAKFIFGRGIKGGDNLIVNRHGETLNEVYMKMCKEYAIIDSHVEHFNFNLLGQISEITNVDLRLVRKLENMIQVRLDNWAAHLGVIYTGNRFDIFIYNQDALKQQIQKDGGFDKSKGAIYYWTLGNEIYTIAPGDASLPSAQMENSIQVFNYSAARNSFNGSGVFKVPQLQGNAIDNADVDEQIARLHGPENAGAFIKITIPRNVDGSYEKLNIFETIQQNNVDKMYEVQSKNSRNNILTEYHTPEVLITASEGGLFNIASYNDAFNWYNSETEDDRRLMEISINKFWGNTVFAATLPKIEIIPKEMKTNKSETQKEVEEDGANTNND